MVFRPNAQRFAAKFLNFFTIMKDFQEPTKLTLNIIKISFLNNKYYH